MPKKRSPAPKPQARSEINKRGSGIMHASPVAYVSAALSILALIGGIGQYFTTYATMQSDIIIVKRDLERNFTEDREAHARATKSLERIDATLTNFGNINVKIGVMENQMHTLVDALRRIEKQLDRRSRPFENPMGHDHDRADKFGPNIDKLIPNSNPCCRKVTTPTMLRM